jgi:diaminohydroxyphosphoribosylaminopyrimidine deaminase / 5-amino-6-(5-phosphoribosylamino)uracil reductase
LNETDRHYLERAMDLADCARGQTSPNPVVGAVIVRGGEVLGEGYHVGPGRDHAEVAAMKDVLLRAGKQCATEPAGAAALAWLTDPGVFVGTTMYVSLEPCCTYGRTPPCTDALLKGAFARVVVGAVDPSPAVDGKGLEILRAAGMKVELAEADLARRAKRQNCGARKAAKRGLPCVTYKYAMTLDGRVATDAGDSRWISGEESRSLVHQWRAWSDAVVVGAGTLLADDPTLTARNVECERQPLRVVVDESLRLSRESSLVRTVEQGPVLALCGPDVDAARRREVEAWGVETAVVEAVTGGWDPRSGLDPEAVGRCLVSRDVREVLLEGGARLAGAWWAAGCIDRVAAFVCPRVISGTENRAPLHGPGRQRMEEALELLEVEVKHVGGDVLITGYTAEPF